MPSEGCICQPPQKSTKTETTVSKILYFPSTLKNKKTLDVYTSRSNNSELYCLVRIALSDSQTDVNETWMMWPWQLNTLSMLMFMLKLGRMIKQNLILRSRNLYFEAESWLWFWFWWFYIISIGWWNLRIPQRQRAPLRLPCINQPSTNSKKENALYRRFHICHPPVLRTPPKNTYLIILYLSPNFVVQITATS